MTAEPASLAGSGPRREALDVCRSLLVGAVIVAITGLPVRAQEPDSPAPEGKAERMVDDLFGICDLDDNGWISYAEAEAVFGIEKGRFRDYDTNGDGRVDAEEFADKRGRILRALGMFSERPVRDPLATVQGQAPEESPAPMRPTRALPPARVEPDALLEQHDTDASGGLNREEIVRLIASVDSDLSPDVLLERLDRDASLELEPAELAALGRLAERLTPGPAPSLLAPRPPAPAPPLLDSSGRPVRIAPHVDVEPRAPVGNFERLDRSGDGAISIEDLRGLLAPARVGVRPAAVLAALDRNGDGVIDRDEFLAAMQRP